MPDAHARLGPSAAERWLSCPASIQLSETIKKERESLAPYAQEGTNAHTLAELTARRELLGEAVNLTEWRARVTDDQADEMARFVAGYVDFLRAARAELPHSVLLLERRVETGVPECWGTADAIVVSPTHIHVVDFKYGQGIAVDAEWNPQLMLYGVGALENYGDLLGEVDTVTVSVYQPRINHSNSWTITAADLRAWRDDMVIPVALEAIGPEKPRFGPSETACRFCPAAGDCVARTNVILAEFGAVPDDPMTMPPEQLARVLKMMPDIKNWLASVEEAALRRAYTEGEKLPGWKVVMSGGRRTVPDEMLAVQTLIDAGFNAEQVARLRLRTLADLDKLGATEHLNGQIVRTEGRPSMVPEGDRRPAITATKEMFAE